MTPQIKMTPKDFFYNLGALIALYASVYALLDLIFSIINYLAPDQLSYYVSASDIAWPTSILITLVPTLYILGWLIAKDIKLVPEKKDLWIRRWRIYLTLFLTGIIIATDLITLINTYLGGEISSRFVYKVVAVLIVTGAVFKYYFFTVNDKYKFSQLVRRGNAGFGLVLVIVAIVTGFVLAGSPAKQRLLKFDEQRVIDLQNIQSQVVNYWQLKSKLPASLKELNDPISGYISPVDPETGVAYEYKVLGDKQFSLCGIFDLASINNNGMLKDYSSPLVVVDVSNDIWKHEAGDTCFTRTIDPEKYPPVPKNK